MMSDTTVKAHCGAMWPNLGPIGGLWTCTLDMGHDGDHEALGMDDKKLTSSPSSTIPRGHEDIVVGRDDV